MTDFNSALTVGYLSGTTFSSHLNIIDCFTQTSRRNVIEVHRGSHETHTSPLMYSTRSLPTPEGDIQLLIAPVCSPVSCQQYLLAVWW